MNTLNNYNVSFGAKFGPKLKQQILKRDGNGEQLYAAAIEKTFEKKHSSYLFDRLVIEHINNGCLRVYHELYPDICSHIYLKVPKGSTLSGRILAVEPIKFIRAQLEVAQQCLKEGENFINNIWLEKSLKTDSNKTIRLFPDYCVDDATNKIFRTQVILDEYNAKKEKIMEIYDKYYY